MRVPLLDLKPQYQSLKAELDKKLIDTAESQYFILGPEVRDMETEIAGFLGARHAVGVSSGSDALLVSLMALGIGPGDEVIVPTFSFFASAGVISRLSATPVFADIDPVTFNLDPKDIEHRITNKTKAIIPVHLYGQSCDMDPIMDIAKKYDLRVVEDGAQAISAQYKDGRPVGTIGDLGCYSFFPSKNLGCFGDGGLVVTNDDKLYERLLMLRVHGSKVRYHHSLVGGNFRLDALQAGVIRIKLPHLNSWSQARRDNAGLYNRLFIEHSLATEEGRTSFSEKERLLLPKAVYKESGHENYHIFNQYVIRVEKRDELKDFLFKNEIASEIYYPISFHEQECFSSLGYKKGDFPQSEFVERHCLAIPIYPELSTEQISLVVDKIAEFMKS